MSRYLLGTDNGCTVAKAALFDLSGKEIGVASRKAELLTPKPGHFERDAEQMWLATAETIREVIRKTRVNPSEIAAVACTGHGNGLYLTDKRGKAVRMGITSMDSRARDYIEKWQAQGIGEKVRPKTMQSLWPGQPNALLAWLQDNEPETMKQAAWAFMCKDYIRCKLTGEAAAELTDMSATSLMDLRSLEYDRELFDLWGIGKLMRLMPKIVRSSDLCGCVTKEAAELTGLKEKTPVAGGLFDIDACGLASGLVDENQLCVVAGTWGNNQFISRTPVVDKDVFMTSCYSIPGYYLMLEGSPTSAGNFEWFATEFFKADMQLPGNSKKSVYDVCDEHCAGSREDPGLFFLPFVMGANANPYAKGAFMGLTARHGRGDMVRAVFEGVVFSHKWHVERLMRFTKMPGCIRLTGGVARNERWVQMFADCFQVPVQIPEATELGALGAAITAGVSVKCFGSFEEACGKMVKFSRTQGPDAARKGYYADKFRRYLKILDTMDPVWKEIH
jgi:L-xylulokinase